MRSNKLLISLLALSMLAVGSQGAFAYGTQTFTFLGYGNPGIIGTNVTISVDGTSKAVYAGRYLGKFNNSPAFNIFCVDVRHTINWNASFTTLVTLGRTMDPAYPWQPATGFYENGAQGAPGGLASALTNADYMPAFPSGSLNVVQRSRAVAWLGTTYLNASLTAQQAAAIQLAIWDIVQDGGDGLAAGTFQVSGNGVASLAPTYISEAIANANWGGPDETVFIQARRTTSAGDHLQDFIFHNPGTYVQVVPIPEPVFFQLGTLAGLGGLSLFRRRRA